MHLLHIIQLKMIQNIIKNNVQMINNILLIQLLLSNVYHLVQKTNHLSIKIINVLLNAKIRNII